MVIGGKNKNKRNFKRTLFADPTFTEHNTIVLIHDASSSIFHSTIICVAIKKGSFQANLILSSIILYIIVL